MADDAKPRRLRREHMQVRSSDVHGLVEQCNLLGADGWRLVQFTSEHGFQVGVLSRVAMEGDPPNPVLVECAAHALAGMTASTR